MLVNADFSLPVVLTPGEHRWVASPQAGVERVQPPAGLLLHDELACGATTCPAGTWMRQPAGRAPEVLAGRRARPCP